MVENDVKYTLNFLLNNSGYERSRLAKRYGMKMMMKKMKQWAKKKNWNQKIQLLWFIKWPRVKKKNCVPNVNL